jgi:hypothetical protein
VQRSVSGGIPDAEAAGHTANELRAAGGMTAQNGQARRLRLDVRRRLSGLPVEGEQERALRRGRIVVRNQIEPDPAVGSWHSRETLVVVHSERRRQVHLVDRKICNELRLPRTASNARSR